jgi:calcineurin-like phosphoesterase family protein
LITLYMGDPHARTNNLEEMKSLVLFTVETIKTRNVSRLVILGDLHHTHDILKLQVIEFWTWALDLFDQTCETVVLVGNHDRSNNLGDTYSSLAVFSMMGMEKVSIINYPIRINTFAYVPYIHDQAEFVRASNELYDRGARVLICHADWDGSQYDSGAYSPNGVKPADLKFDLIIGGHIHKRQRFGKVILPGTPRWDTASDANEPKGLWLVNHDELTGAILTEEFISTEHVCQPIISLTYKEGDAGIPTWAPNAKVALEIIGSSVWVAQEKLKFKGRCSISTKFTDTKKVLTRDPGKGFEDYMSKMFISKLDKKELLLWAKELGIV